MGTKGRGENQDYYKTGGSRPASRGSFAQEKQHLRSSQHPARAQAAPPHHGVSVKATGAGAQTVERATQRRQSRSEEEVEHEDVERVASGQSAAQPSKMLPAAQTRTELNDLIRDVREAATTGWRALLDLSRSLWTLARSPFQLARLLRQSA